MSAEKRTWVTSNEEIPEGADTSHGGQQQPHKKQGKHTQQKQSQFTSHQSTIHCTKQTQESINDSQNMKKMPNTSELHSATIPYTFCGDAGQPCGDQGRAARCAPAKRKRNTDRGPGNRNYIERKKNRADKTRRSTEKERT